MSNWLQSMTGVLQPWSPHLSINPGTILTSLLNASVGTYVYILALATALCKTEQFSALNLVYYHCTHAIKLDNFLIAGWGDVIKLTVTSTFSHSSCNSTL